MSVHSLIFETQVFRMSELSDEVRALCLNVSQVDSLAFQKPKRPSEAAVIFCV